MIPRMLVVIITISVLIAVWQKPDVPPRLVQTDYCVVTYRAAVKDERGWHFGWGEGYGPCSLQDKYREI